jgi:alkyl sulfatase BDS1-like metallo-beta-lactamase superfamily hydrolase
MMGGAARIVSKGREHAQEILNKLVYAEPANQVAKDLLADVWEQIGYQQESPSARNSFLAGAYELRSGIPTGASPKGTGPDMIRGMTTGLFLDFLGVRLQSEKVEGQSFVINLVTPDNGEKYVIELSNGTLTNIQGQQAPRPTLTVTVNRADLESVMAGSAGLGDLAAAGRVKLDGDRKPFDLLNSSLAQFDMGFEILPGTKPRTGR